MPKRTENLNPPTLSAWRPAHTRVVMRHHQSAPSMVDVLTRLDTAAPDWEQPDRVTEALTVHADRIARLTEVTRDASSQRFELADLDAADYSDRAERVLTAMVVDGRRRELDTPQLRAQFDHAVLHAIAASLPDVWTWLESNTDKFLDVVNRRRNDDEHARLFTWVHDAAIHHESRQNHKNELEQLGWNNGVVPELRNEWCNRWQWRGEHHRREAVNARPAHSDNLPDYWAAAEGAQFVLRRTYMDVGVEAALSVPGTNSLGEKMAEYQQAQRLANKGIEWGVGLDPAKLKGAPPRIELDAAGLPLPANETA